MEWKKILAIHVSDKGLLACGIYREPPKLNNNSSKAGQRT